MTPALRRATPDDATRLSQFAAQAFRETFEQDNSPENMERYLAESFSPERQRAEISDPAGTVLLAEQSGELAGYVHLTKSPAPSGVEGRNPLELKRLYVGRAWHGKGIAQALMDAALEAARAQGADTLWLGVWERNARAIAFYRKYGFFQVGEHTFMLGDDAQTDWLLARPISL